ncbi:hypothetical protein ACFLY8_04990 [Halobacteriota archaeon]
MIGGYDLIINSQAGRAINPLNKKFMKDWKGFAGIILLSIMLFYIGGELIQRLETLFIEQTPLNFLLTNSILFVVEYAHFKVRILKRKIW